MVSTTRRRLAPVAAGAAAVVVVITGAVVSQRVDHRASPTVPALTPTRAPSYIGLRDFGPTTSGGKVTVAP